MDATRLIARMLRPMLGQLLRKATTKGIEGASGDGGPGDHGRKRAARKHGQKQARRAKQGLRAARRIGRM